MTDIFSHSSMGGHSGGKAIERERKKQWDGLCPWRVDQKARREHDQLTICLFNTIIHMASKLIWIMHTMKRGKMPEYVRMRCTGGCINSGGDRGKRDKGDGGVKRKHEGRGLLTFFSVVKRENILRRLTDKLPANAAAFSPSVKGDSCRCRYSAKTYVQVNHHHHHPWLGRRFVRSSSPCFSSQNIHHLHYSSLVYWLSMHLKPPRVMESPCCKGLRKLYADKVVRGLARSFLKSIRPSCATFDHRIHHAHVRIHADNETSIL